MKIWVIRGCTRRGKEDWIALGKTQDEAINALRVKWDESERDSVESSKNSNYPYDPLFFDDWASEYDSDFLEYHGFWVDEMELGSAEVR